MIYWFGVFRLMSEGLTLEQAREKAYQNLIDKGDLEGAKKLRAYQDIIHPVKTSDQSPLPEPPQPPPDTEKLFRDTG